MLATCVTMGWPAGSYRDPSHPLQRAIRRKVDVDEALLAELGALARPPVHGGGEVVGEIRVKIPAEA
jgi:L-asparaginase II